MKIAILTAFHGRREISELFIKSGNNRDMQIFASVTDDSDAEFCEANNIKYVVTSNSPLSHKWNAGLELMRQNREDFDAIMILGSDDILLGLDVYKQYLKDYDFITLRDFYMIQHNTGKMKYWSGYGSSRADETLGAGRCIRNDLLDKLDWDLWRVEKDNCLDRYSWKTLHSVDMKKKYVNGADGVFLIDIKSDASMTNFAIFKDAEDVPVEISELVKEMYGDKFD